MRNIIKQVLVSPTDKNNQKKQKNPYKRQLGILKKIWAGQHNDFGLERIMRFICCLFQFVSISTLIRFLLGKLGFVWKKIAIDLYLILLILFPIVVLWTGAYDSIIIRGFLIYFVVDTIIYNMNFIFLSDIIPSTASYVRNLIGLFCNYIFVLLAFAVFYMHTGSNEDNMTPIQVIYYSTIVQSTLGFGEIHPNTNAGYITVVAQTLIALVFVCVFFATTISKLRDHTFYNSGQREENK